MIVNVDVVWEKEQRLFSMEAKSREDPHTRTNARGS